MHVPGAEANGATYDIDDMRTNGPWGSMQVHDLDTCTTLFSYTGFTLNNRATSLGIGACSGKYPDWTMADNVPDLPFRRIEVYVLADAADTTPPAAVRATLAGTSKVYVWFTEPVAAASVTPAAFVFNNGVTAADARVARWDASVAEIDLARETSAAGLTLDVRGVRDTAPAANEMAPVTGLAVAAPEDEPLPESLRACVPASAREGFMLLESIDIPLTSTEWVADPASRGGYDATSWHGDCDRVAYCLELVKPALKTNGERATNWVWVAMDPFTRDTSRLGFPWRWRYQQYVTNLTVLANVDGVITGEIPYGNIEFWKEGYTGTSAGFGGGGSFDIDDTITGGGYGSLQIHNTAAKQTILSVSRFVSTGSTICLGIGNNPNGYSDWTHEGTAGLYSSRRLHILVRPCAAAQRPEIAALAPPEHIRAHVPDSAGYDLLYAVDFPTPRPVMTNAANWAACHTTDNVTGVSAAACPAIGGGRLAYYFELVKTTGETQWVWTAFDSFTDDISRVHLPTNWVLKTVVTNLQVRSNVPALYDRDGVQTGNIEFYAYNHSQKINGSVYGGSDTYYDWDDKYESAGSQKYSCMQVHDFGAKQTLFAINGYSSSDAQFACGIGNQNAPGTGHTDWIFANNAGQFKSRRLWVFARKGGRTAYAGTDTAAVPRLAVGSRASRAKVCVTFKNAARPAADAALYTVTKAGGAAVRVLSADVSFSDARDVILTLESPLPAGTACGVAVRAAPGVRAATLAFTTPDDTDAAFITAGLVPERGDYTLVNELRFQKKNYLAGAEYTVDESRFRPSLAFDRVAYCLRLRRKNGGADRWVWVSMDAFTADLAKVGVPTADRAAFFQRIVTDLRVRGYASDGALPCATGDFAAGSIEFWPCDYSAAAYFGLPGGSSSFYDIDDTPNTRDGTTTGYGSMQVHNVTRGETVWVFNHFSGAPYLGMGSRTPGASGNSAKDKDWTFTGETAVDAFTVDDYDVKTLYVFVRPCAARTAGGPVFVLQPADTRVESRSPARLTAYAEGAQWYQWRKNGVEIPGATDASYTIASVRQADAGFYDVIAGGADGARTVSAAARLSMSGCGTVLILR